MIFVGKMVTLVVRMVAGLWKVGAVRTGGEDDCTCCSFTKDCTTYTT